MSQPSAVSGVEKSTIVRSMMTALRSPLLRGVHGVLSGVAPALAARRADRLFMTPPRHEPPAVEREALAEARAHTVDLACGRVRAWAWGTGPGVLLVHGWGGRGAQLRAFVEPLLAAG